MSEFTGLLNHIRARFDAEGVRFVVGGSFALAALGHPRATADIDLMVLTRAADLAPIHRALMSPRLTLINDVTFSDEGTGLLLDVIPVLDEAQRAAFDRATEVPFEGTSGVRVLSAEGLALMLLREATIGDAGRRDRRMLDLETIASNHTLDWGFLTSWVRKMGYHEAYALWKHSTKPKLA